jgi:hypothetical protein
MYVKTIAGARQLMKAAKNMRGAPFRILAASLINSGELAVPH